MIQNLKIKNFTVFEEADVSFSPGLNVIIGENGLGKSHLLKLGYSMLSSLSPSRDNEQLYDAPTKGYLEKEIAKQLSRVFMPDQLGRLATRKQGRNRCEVQFSFENKKLNTQFSFSFSTQSKNEVNLKNTTNQWLDKPPVYLPTRELMSIYPNFVSIYNNTSGLKIDSTWRDTCDLLGALGKRGPRENKIKTLLEPIEVALGGKVLLEENGFYLQLKSGKMEMHLVAEGLRKLAMIARLIETGSLLDKGYLFWDEPEANLNPRLIKKIAKTILHLTKNGIQVILATHSLFLLREFEILLAESSSHTPMFFGLSTNQEGLTEIQQSSSLDEIDPLILLDESISQSDRYLSLP